MEEVGGVQGAGRHQRAGVRDAEGWSAAYLHGMDGACQKIRRSKGHVECEGLLLARSMGIGKWCMCRRIVLGSRSWAVWDRLGNPRIVGAFAECSAANQRATFGIH